MKKTFRIIFIFGFFCLFFNFNMNAEKLSPESKRTNLYKQSNSSLSKASNVKVIVRNIIRK
jgi:hypothetical protein